MRPYILSECNWKYIKDQDFDLAILPWGATEAHNFHLPYATDIIEADHISAEAARLAWDEGAKVIVLPTVPFGVNTGQRDIKLDLNMNPSTQMAVLNDIIQVLDMQNIHKLIVMNSHGGNNFKTMLRELGVRFPNMLLFTCDWYHALDKSKYFEHEGDHADEMETSLIMHLRPDLVLPLNEAGDGIGKKIDVSGYREGWVWAERKWSKATNDTGIGYPKAATAEKGKRYFRDVCRKLAHLLIELCDLDQEDHYAS